MNLLGGNIIGSSLMRMSKLNLKRGNIQMTMDSFADQQLINTLKMPSKKRTSDEISFLEDTLESKQYFKKFKEEYGRQGLRDLLKSCYYEYLTFNR